MSEPATTDGNRSSPVRTLARRRPITMFVVIVIGLSWPVMIALLAVGQDVSPGILLMVIFLLGAATLITGLGEGRAGVRRLFAGAIRWRMGLARFLVLVTAMPLLTLLVGVVTGTLQSPANGWLALVGSYLFQTFIFGLLIVNLWEETAWGGFAQSRLMARHGLLIGSLLTAIPFFAIHIPLAFADQGWKGTTGAQAALQASGADRSRCAILPVPARDTAHRLRRQCARDWTAARVLQRFRRDERGSCWVAVHTRHDRSEPGRHRVSPVARPFIRPWLRSGVGSGYDDHA